jgi:hypothetical protein
MNQLVYKFCYSIENGCAWINTNHIHVLPQGRALMLLSCRPRRLPQPRGRCCCCCAAAAAATSAAAQAAARGGRSQPGRKC